MIPFALGEALVGVVAYFVRDWRYLQLAVAAPAFILVTYYWLVAQILLVSGADTTG